MQDKFPICYQLIKNVFECLFLKVVWIVLSKIKWFSRLWQQFFEITKEFCLQKGKTINFEYYTKLLYQLNKKTLEHRPGLAKKKIIFHQDNAPAHKTILTIAKIKKLMYKLLDHPLYSPDLAPSDYYLFPNPKKFLAGKHFTSNEEAITAVDMYFADKQ